MFELGAEHDRNWVVTLCPDDLMHFYGLMIQRRSTHLRELLHVHVSAAALAGGKAKMVEDLDKELARRARPEGESGPTEPRVLEGPERKEAEQTFADAMSAFRRG